MRRKITVILAPFCALLLSCGGCDLSGRAVTYKVDGDASEASICYHDEYEDKVCHSSVDVPWEKTFNIQFRGMEYYGGGARRENYTAYISADLFKRPSFPATVSIYVDGELVQSASTKPSDVGAVAVEAAAYYKIYYCD